MRNRYSLALSLLVLVCSTPRPGSATWSIVAVDPDTGEVGAAAATCTVGLELAYGVAPGKGVIMAQAATNLTARDKGVELINGGAGAAEVVAHVATQEFNPGGWLRSPWHEQQYGVAVLRADPLTASFTGDETVPWSGGITEAGVSVQGNMLRGEEVVRATLRAFQEGGRADTCKPTLAERLIRALEAGAAQGGDNRCSRERAALTAFVAVTQAEAPLDTAPLFLIAPRAFGILGSIRHELFPYSPSSEIPPAVTELRAKYETWLRADPNRMPSPCDSNTAP